MGTVSLGVIAHSETRCVCLVKSPYSSMFDEMLRTADVEHCVFKPESLAVNHGEPKRPLNKSTPIIFTRITIQDRWHQLHG